MARLFMFLAGSILVGFLTRSAAQQRERITTASFQQKLALAEADPIRILSAANDDAYYPRTEKRTFRS